ncbi:MAG: glycine zipper 2TM domain-containing protein [Hyphomonas sp.]
MMKSLLIGTVALCAVAAAPLAASAQSYGYSAPYNSACERQNSDDKAAGTVIGALLGAAAGGAIGNNIGDNDSDWHYTRYGRHGRHGYWEKGNNDGEVLAGALLGAIVGGVAGNAMASGNAQPCQVATPYGGSYRADYGSYPAISASYSGDSIPRTTQGLYGGPGDLRSHPQAAYTPAPAPTNYPAPAPAQPSYPRAAPQAAQPEECRTVWRETKLPDGSVQRDPATACRQGYNGEWNIVGGDEELYGY